MAVDGETPKGSLEELFAWAEAHEIDVTVGLQSAAKGGAVWPKYTASIAHPPVMVGADSPVEALAEAIDRWIRAPAEPDLSDAASGAGAAE